MPDDTAVPAGLAVEPRHWVCVQAILKTCIPDREVWAFGSRVGGQPKPYSDLDLAVLGEEPLSMAQLAQLTEAFSDSDLPWRVDVVDWATTSESFKALIAAHKLTIQVPAG